MLSIQNNLITLYPLPQSFQGEKGVGFHLERKGGKGKSPVYLINPYQNATLVD